MAGSKNAGKRVERGAVAQPGGARDEVAEWGGAHGGRSAAARPGGSRGAGSHPGGAGSLRVAGVRTRKYLGDYFRNPAMIGTALIPVGAAVLFHAISAGIVDGAGDAAFDEWLSTLYVLYAFMFSGLMAATMLVMYDMGEEAEKGARGVLLRAGVTHGQLAAGHLAAASVFLFGMCLASGLVMGLDVQTAVPLVVLCALCQLPLVIAGCAAGLFARTQNDVMVSSTPFIVVALVPFMLYMTDSFDSLIPFLPAGGVFGIAESLAAGNLLGGLGPVCLGATLAWLVAAVVVLVWAVRRVKKSAA